MTLTSLITAPLTIFWGRSVPFGMGGDPLCSGMSMGLGTDKEGSPTNAGLQRSFLRGVIGECSTRKWDAEGDFFFSTSVTKAGPDQYLALGCRGWCWDEDFERSQV